MNKICIISGGGQLPINIGNNLIGKNYEVIFICLKKYSDLSLYKNYNYVEESISSLSNILKILDNKKIDQIVMAGNILRPSIKDINFDLNTIKLIKDYFLESKGDDALLKSISNFFLKKGYPIFEWTKECNELFANHNDNTFLKPSKLAFLNLKKGLDIFSTIGKIDIGQSLIIQNQLILGIEAIEGTDELIKRCFEYKKKGDKGVLLKLNKYNQSFYLDNATIGLNTLNYLKKYNYEGVFVEENKTIMLNKPELIKFCEINKLFIHVVKKIES